MKRVCGIFFTALFQLAALLVLLYDDITVAPDKQGYSVMVQRLLLDEIQLPVALMLAPLNLELPAIIIEPPQLELPLGKFVPPQPMVIVGAKFAPDVVLLVPAAGYPVNLREIVDIYHVEVAVQILEDGAIGEINIEKSSGYDALDNFVITYAVKHWRFIPSMSDGEKVMSWKTVRVEITAKEMMVRS